MVCTVLQNVKNLIKSLQFLYLPVSISKGSVSIIYAGYSIVKREYFLDRFAGKDRSPAQKLIFLPIFLIAPYLRFKHILCDILLIENQSVSARFLLSQRFILVPEFFQVCIPLSDHFESLTKSCRPMRRAEALSQNPAYTLKKTCLHSDFDTFYHTMYTHYLQRKYGERAALAPHWEVRAKYPKSELHYVEYEGKTIAGGLIQIQGTDMILDLYGRADGFDPTGNDDVYKILLVYLIKYAFQKSCTQILMGGTHPFLNDGLTYFKFNFCGQLLKGSHSFANNIAIKFFHDNEAVRVSMQKNPLVAYDKNHTPFALIGLTMAQATNPEMLTKLAKSFYAHRFPSMVFIQPDGCKNDARLQTDDFKDKTIQSATYSDLVHHKARFLHHGL